jgi:hypothetical protein
MGLEARIMSLWDRWRAAMVKRCAMFAAPRVRMPLETLPATFRPMGYYKRYVIEAKAPGPAFEIAGLVIPCAPGQGPMVRRNVLLWQWGRA